MEGWRVRRGGEAGGWGGVVHGPSVSLTWRKDSPTEREERTSRQTSFKERDREEMCNSACEHPLNPYF
jgi:hypothetical protein